MRNVVVFLIVLCLYVDGQEPNIVERKVDDLNRRLESGDYSAFDDAAELPTSDALRFLNVLYERRGKSDPVWRAGIVKALRNVRGYSDYLSNDVAATIQSGKMPYEDFRILSAIGTRDAQSIAAFYLFNFNKIETLGEGGQREDDWICGEALLVLEQMNIPGSPKLGEHSTNSTLLLEWQRWAIKSGLVPKDWETRIGAPTEWGKFDAETSPPLSVQKSTPAIFERSSGNDLGASSVPVHSSAQTNKGGLRTAIVFGAVAIVLIFGGFLLFRKRL